MGVLPQFGIDPRMGVGIAENVGLHGRRSADSSHCAAARSRSSGNCAKLSQSNSLWLHHTCQLALLSRTGACALVGLIQLPLIYRRISRARLGIMQLAKPKR